MIPTITAGDPSCKDKFPMQEAKFWDFVGGWGHAEFTFRTLLIRAILGFARFSDSTRGFPFIRFLGYQMQLIRAPEISYLFRPEGHRGKQDYEDVLQHPAHFINLPFVKIVESIIRSKCCKHPWIKRRADPSIFGGWHDITDFQNVRLTGYQWTTIDMDNPLGKNPQMGRNTESPIINNWMGESKDQQMSTYCPSWLNIEKFDEDFVKYINRQITGNAQDFWDWILPQTGVKPKMGPFKQSLINTSSPNTLWFRYRFFFQLGGAGIGRLPPEYPIREADTCEPCKKTCEACIKEGDLDRWGLLKKAAFNRITGLTKHRKKAVVAKLAKLVLLRQRDRAKRKRVRFSDEEEEKGNNTHFTFS
nr:MAG: ORF1 [Anelloviridae sp.]